MRDLLLLIADYDGPALRPVLEGNKLDNSDIQSCRDHAVRLNDTRGVQICNLLLGMKRNERKKALNVWAGEDVDE